jgi:hypothetical protein
MIYATQMAYFVGLVVQVAARKMLFIAVLTKFVPLDMGNVHIIGVLQHGTILLAALTRYVITSKLKYKMHIGTTVRHTKTVMLPSGAVISGK